MNDGTIISKTFVGFIMVVVCLPIGGYLLSLTQRNIPMGTTYTVWIDIGTENFVPGISVYRDPAGI